MDDEVPKRRFYLVNHEDDIPTTATGVLIPRQVKSVWHPSFKRGTGFLLSSLFVLILIVMVGTFSMPPLGSKQSANVYSTLPTAPATELLIGVNNELGKVEEVEEWRNNLIAQEKNFIELDIEAKQVRFFNKGVLAISQEINSIPEKSSPFHTPPGLYQVTNKTEEFYSDLEQIYLPYRLTFDSNFLLHGEPKLEGGEAANFGLGGFVVKMEAIEKIFKQVEVGDYVFVHKPKRVGDSFIYEPKVEGVNAPNYLIADLDNDTVLASSDLAKAVPIASLTKLMTALIVAENLPLEKKVSVSESSFVTSLIPRLKARQEVSIYSLLELLLVESSNEAAEVLAEAVGREKFINLMNKKAKELSMLETEFVDPSGLSAGNISSSRDLLSLTKYLKQNRNFIFEISANGGDVQSGSEFGDLINFNQVRNLENFIGGKVGETIAAGQTSVSLHHLDIANRKRTIAVVVLGSTSRDADVLTLLNYAKGQFGR